LASVVCAEDIRHFGERAKGLLQITYALVIAYGFFITLALYDRKRLSRIFLGFCLFMIVGVVFENYTDFREFSDQMRRLMFEKFVYASDERDLLLYGSIRPKLFTSEPSVLSFAFTLYAFCWYALSTWRGKIVAYAILLGIGYYLIRSPTIFVGFIAVIPYDLLVSSRRWDGYASGSGLPIVAAVGSAMVLGAIGLVLMESGMLDERIEQITTQSDQSFFSRVIGPALVAFDTVARHPFAGAGLTGEEFIERRVFQIYTSSPGFDPRWYNPAASEVLTNYFWLHWTYLGLFWGMIIAGALTLFVRNLGTVHPLFCWVTWVIFGQASGAYVSPKTWTVLMLACAISVVVEAERRRLPAAVGAGLRRGLPARRWVGAVASGK
jgi:hypothetical protein